MSLGGNNPRGRDQVLNIVNLAQVQDREPSPEPSPTSAYITQVRLTITPDERLSSSNIEDRATFSIQIASMARIGPDSATIEQ
jgi:hypothetical protein